MPVDAILSHFRSSKYFFEIRFNIIKPFTPKSSKFSIKISYGFIIALSAKLLIQVILLNFIIQANKYVVTMSLEKSNLW